MIASSMVSGEAPFLCVSVGESLALDAAAFVDKWRKSRRSERSASQEHFLDLCEVLKHPKPGAVDPKGLTFTTERRVTKEGGKHGFADAWKKAFFQPVGTDFVQPVGSDTI